MSPFFEAVCPMPGMSAQVLKHARFEPTLQQNPWKTLWDSSANQVIISRFTCSASDRVPVSLPHTVEQATEQRLNAETSMRPLFDRSRSCPRPEVTRYRYITLYDISWQNLTLYDRRLPGNTFSDALACSFLTATDSSKWDITMFIRLCNDQRFKPEDISFSSADDLLKSISDVVKVVWTLVSEDR